VLKLILSDLAPDERLAQLHEKLASLRGRLERGEVAITELAIAKTLTRAPEQYADKKGLPHVTVALRLNTKGGRKLKQGDTVHYVICNVSTRMSLNVSTSQREREV
jgi:DNA polymerase alpha subunit A